MANLYRPLRTESPCILCPDDSDAPMPVANHDEEQRHDGPTTWDPLIAEAAKAPDVEPLRVLSAGAQVGEYVVEEMLGQGGFGTVYRAVHPVIGKAVAIKVLREQLSDNPVIVSRFVQEGCAVNRILHPNIVDIFGYGSLENGQKFLVMELLHGESLGQRIRRTGPIPADSAIAILRGIASALDATHAQNILHRDLKPENVFLATSGKNELVPKLLDFGIAKNLDHPQQHGAEPTRGVVGTRAYMSPEQCVGAAVDARTDIYSLGIIAYEMLTGRHPFDRETALKSSIRSRSVGIPASSGCPWLPESIDEPLTRMFALDPDRRPSSAVVAVEALASAMHVNSPAPRLRERRGYRYVVAGLICVVGAGIYAATSLLGSAAFRSSKDSSGQQSQDATQPESARLQGEPSRSTHLVSTVEDLPRASEPIPSSTSTGSAIPNHKAPQALDDTGDSSAAQGARVRSTGSRRGRVPPAVAEKPPPRRLTPVPSRSHPPRELPRPRTQELEF